MKGFGFSIRLRYRFSYDQRQIERRVRGTAERRVLVQIVARNVTKLV
jgi:hypothetical protein